MASGSGGPTAGARLGLGFSAQLNPYYLVIFNPSAGIDCCPSNECEYVHMCVELYQTNLYTYILITLLSSAVLSFASFWAFKDHNK